MMLVRGAKSFRRISRPGVVDMVALGTDGLGGRRAGLRGTGYEQDGREGGYGHPCSQPHESSTASGRVSFREVGSLGSWIASRSS